MATRRHLTLAIGGALLAALLSGLLAMAPSAPAAEPKPWGKITAADQTLRSGCHRYRIRYVVKAPTNRWAAELFMINPNGRRLASFAVDVDSDPARGYWRPTICRWSTVYGKHVLRMKVTWQRDRNVYDGYVRNGSFRFTRP